MKIRNRLRIVKAVIIIFLTTACSSYAQDTPRLRVIDQLQEYSDQVRDDSSRQMVELKSAIPGLVYDLRYATTDNFMKRRMYPKATAVTFLRSPAALTLGHVQRELNKKGLGLKIFDAYRPYSVTVKFWELVRDERYVANPAKGSGHNRGIAVDLTIIHLHTGTELDMGTGFDNFSDTAHHSFTALTDEVLQNRKLLRSLMEKYGFKALETEWWHYYFADGKFDVLDIPFKKLKKPS